MVHIYYYNYANSEIAQVILLHLQYVSFYATFPLIWVQKQLHRTTDVFSTVEIHRKVVDWACVGGKGYLMIRQKLLSSAHTARQQCLNVGKNSRHSPEPPRNSSVRFETFRRTETNTWAQPVSNLRRRSEHMLHTALQHGLEASLKG